MPCPMPPVSPIDVWDIRDYDNWWRKWGGVSKEFKIAMRWAYDNIGNIDRCYRIEFYVFDTAFCVVFRYDEGPSGRLIMYPPTGEAVKENPAIQFVSSLPFPYEAEHG